MQQQEKINVAIADDHVIFRDGLKASLKKISIVGQIYQCKNGQEVINLLENNDVEVLLLDIEMPVMNGIETARWIIKNKPEVNIIVLTMFNNRRYIMELYDIGVSGYLMKNTDVSELKKAITMALQGDSYYCTEAQNVIFKDLLRRDKVSTNGEAVKNISAREMEVLKLICEQHGTEEIAEKLFISPLTVKRHRQILMEKTNSKNLAGLVVFSIKNDIYKIY
ncbi:MAG: response regulator transcription factor [Bacteroidia bacterium]|nr:response regulator transcription factor [Bacteroidia bacterium]